MKKKNGTAKTEVGRTAGGVKSTIPELEFLSYFILEFIFLLLFYVVINSYLSRRAVLAYIIKKRSNAEILLQSPMIYDGAEKTNKATQGVEPEKNLELLSKTLVDKIRNNLDFLYGRESVREELAQFIRINELYQD